jgi:hypothetical protein
VTGVIFFAVKIGDFFKNNPDGHEYPYIMVGDRGWVKTFKLVVDVNI